MTGAMQLTFYVSMEGIVFPAGPGFTAIDLAEDVRVKVAEQHLDRVMDELMSDDRANDAAIDATLASGTVQVSMAVNAENPIDATNVASMILRAAIHAAGGGTPDWPPLDSPEWGLVLKGLNVRESVLADA